MTSTLETDQYGNKFWRNEIGQYHKENGPAQEMINGDKFWYKKGKLHRENGAAVYNEEVDKDKYWFINGQLHREDGPAIEIANGNKVWYIYGKLHREDGPAIENIDGFNKWYLNDEKLSKEDYHLHLINMKICPLDYQKFNSKNVLEVHFDDHLSKGETIPEEYLNKLFKKSNQ